MREIKTKSELLDMLRLEASKHDACKGVYVGPILEDNGESGCNWKLGVYLKNKEYACIDCIKPFYSSLQEKYNVPATKLPAQQEKS